MDAERQAHLITLLCGYPDGLHVGRKIPIHLYKGDEHGWHDYIGTMHDPELAEMVVLLHEYATERLIRGAP